MSRDHTKMDLRRVLMNTSWIERISQERWLEAVKSGNEKLGYREWKSIQVSTMVSEIQKGMNPGRDYEAPKVENDPAAGETPLVDVTQLNSDLTEHLRVLSKEALPFLSEEQWVMSVTAGDTEKSYWGWRDERMEYIAEGLSSRIGECLKAAAENEEGGYQAPSHLARSLFSFALEAGHHMVIGQELMEMDRISRLMPEGLANALARVSETPIPGSDDLMKERIKEICENYEITGEGVDALKTEDADETPSM